MVIIPFAGLISDKVGRRPLILAGALGIALFIIPYLEVIRLGNFYLSLVAQLAIAIPAATYFAVTPVAMVEMMKDKVRYSASSIAYAFGASIFGGSTPLIAMTLTHKLQSSLAPGIYLIICAVFAIISCSLMKETYKG